MNNSKPDPNKDVAQLTHEIRTPLATILGYAELLLMDDKWDEEAREYVGYIIENIEHLDEKLSTLMQLEE